MTIDVYGATWCGDCRQAKNTLDKLGAAYTWHNIEEEEGAADRAVAISGQMHIPVVRYDDGSFQVEPSAVDIKNKLQELNDSDMKSKEKKQAFVHWMYESGYSNAQVQTVKDNFAFSGGYTVKW